MKDIKQILTVNKFTTLYRNEQYHGYFLNTDFSVYFISNNVKKYIEGLTLEINPTTRINSYRQGGRFANLSTGEDERGVYNMVYAL